MSDLDDIRTAVDMVRTDLCDRARDILARLYAIEHTRDLSTADDDWQSHPLAIEYRSLLCEWWTLPPFATTSALYDSPSKVTRHYTYHGLTWKGRLPYSWGDRYALGLVDQLESR